MAANVIASRIAGFLEKYPPFTHLRKEELSQLAEAAVVRHFESGAYVFRQGEEKQNFLFVLKEGCVHLEREEGSKAVLVDTCDEGDLFGVRAMLSGRPYVFHAHCVEECLVYCIPIGLFRPMLEAHNDIALFFASGLAGGQAGIFDSYMKQRPTYTESASMLNWNHPLQKTSRTLVWASPNLSIKEVAVTMTTNKIGSMVLCDESGDAVGIVTDTDFRTKVGTGNFEIDEPVSSIMSTNVINMPLGLPLSSYLLEMLRNRIRHICIVSAGKAIGVLSERDLVAAHQNHPIALLHAIEESDSLGNLKQLRDQADELIRSYLEQTVSIGLTSSLTTHINDAVISKVIQFAKKLHGAPPVAFAWLALGSEGRSEQLIRTDQDNCLVYADVTGTKEELLMVQKYFLGLAFEVNHMLEELGFQRCPADMMAGNPQWCQPLSRWKDYFTNWIKEPEERALMFASIFFDFRKIYGDDGIVSELKQHLEYEIKDEKIFLNFLAKNALKNPAPLSFFRNFVVERSGEHQDRFDIKSRAMMPLADIARVLSLDAGQLDEMNTVARYRKLAELETKRSELYQAAADSYEYLMRIRALKGFENNSTGRFIPIEALGKLDRQILRNAFDPINQLQKMLELRYQLSYFQ